MIQRKQSIFLLLGAIALGIVFVIDGIFDGPAATSLVWFTPSLIATGAATVILAVGTIFLYENRQLQQKLVVITQVLDLVFIVLLFGGQFLTGSLSPFGSGPDAVSGTAVLLLPVLAYVFFYLARRGIRADIELVRSMDRLR